MAPRKKAANKPQVSTADTPDKKAKVIKTRTPTGKKPTSKIRNNISQLTKPKVKTNKQPKTTTTPQKKNKNPYMVMRVIAQEEKIRMANETALCQLSHKVVTTEVAVNPEPKVVKKKGRQPQKLQDLPQKEPVAVQQATVITARNTRASTKLTGKIIEPPCSPEHKPKPRRGRRKAVPVDPEGKAQEKMETSPTRCEAKSPSNETHGEDNFSWACDISSSSPATVASNSLIALDGKLPSVHLVDIKHSTKRKLPPPNVGRSKRKRGRPRRYTKVVREPSPSSSSSTDSSSTTTTVNSKADLIAENTRILNTLDLEFIKWLSNDSGEEVDPGKPIHERTMKVMKYEIKAIKLCQEFRRKLGHVVEREPILERIELEREVSERDVKEMTNGDERAEAAPDITDKPYEFESFSDVMRRKTLEQSHVYDDDALSLFAESLTGIDSSRDNVLLDPKSNDIEEPVVERILPTPIVLNAKKPVCEKQNADSTSINKEESKLEHSAVPDAAAPPLPLGCTISKSFLPMIPTKSSIYRGHCFFNIVKSCHNNGSCQFPHTWPEAAAVVARLQLVSTELLFREYLLTRRYEALRKQYLVFFVAECERRALTRRLVEMAADSLAEEKPLRTAILETVLLHLNDKLLHQYEDLLVSKVEGVYLCDAFVGALAMTQNFTRFKRVFVTLTEFCVKICRQFPLDVVVNIFERVYILPYEECLVKATVALVRSTEAAIFEHPLMGKFLSRLGEALPLVLEKLLRYKENVTAEAASQPPPPAPHPPDENRRYTSPDTTHLDALNKSPDENRLTRTVTFHQQPPRTSPQFLGPGDEPCRRACAPRGRWGPPRGPQTIFNKLFRFPRGRFQRPPPPGYYGQ